MDAAWVGALATVCIAYVYAVGGSGADALFDGDLLTGHTSVLYIVAETSVAAVDLVGPPDQVEENNGVNEDHNACSKVQKPENHSVANGNCKQSKDPNHCDAAHVEPEEQNEPSWNETNVHHKVDELPSVSRPSSSVEPDQVASHCEQHKLYDPYCQEQIDVS